LTRSRTGADVLTKRQLNRALLARQMLLEREKIAPLAVIETLVAMQAQIPRPPFMGFWTRLKDFEREDLLRLLREKKAVRATAFRGTIHLMSTKDFLAIRPLLSEMLERGASTIVAKRMGGVDVAAIHKEGRAFFGATPTPFDEFRKHLERKFPKLDVRALAYTVRMGVPLVMLPTEAVWGFPANADFGLAEKWLAAKFPANCMSLETLVLRYLAAFGPATPGDAQVWSGLRGLRDMFEKLRPKLVTFRDERKRELFDLPDAPRPKEDTPAPVRFLPEYDNALLAHDDRTRIVADEHRRGVFLTNLQVVGTFLVDGFVAGTWKTQRKKKSATLTLKPFVPVLKKSAAALEAEGEALLRFLEPDASTSEVRLERAE
jgi:hypothetical protein